MEIYEQKGWFSTYGSLRLSAYYCCLLAICCFMVDEFRVWPLLIQLVKGVQRLLFWWWGVSTISSVCPNNSTHFCLVGSCVISLEPRRLMTHSSGPLIHWSVQVSDAIPPPTVSRQEGASLVSYWLDFRQEGKSGIYTNICALLDITREYRKHIVKNL